MDLLLIGGVSGSGKSVALAALEDSGYYVVSHLPLTQLPGLLGHLKNARQDRVAIGLDVKTEPALAGLAMAIDAARAEGWQVRFLYLDAKTDTLVKRFSETRRRHPFSSDDRTLTEAIEFERERLAEVRQLGYSFDTSDLAAAALRVWVKDFVSVDPSRMTLLFQSFGFKHGVPLDSDLVFDVRCLPNPHYEPALSALNGKDAPVIEYLEAYPEVQRMYGDIYHFVASWLPDYARDNRNYLTVSIGCTGGQHRSVYLAERLARTFERRYQVLIRHRELHVDARVARRLGSRRQGARPTPLACRTTRLPLRYNRVMTVQHDARTITLAFTGASGLPHGLRLLECLIGAGVRVYLLYSSAAQIVARQELDLTLPTQPAAATTYFAERYKAAPGQLTVFGREDWYCARRVGLESRRRDDRMSVQHGHARRHRGRPRRQPDRARRGRHAEGTPSAGPGAA